MEVLEATDPLLLQRPFYQGPDLVLCSRVRFLRVPQPGSAVAPWPQIALDLQEAPEEVEDHLGALMFGNIGGI